MTADVLYNEIDDYAADWLENLIRLDLIAPGIVDRRSIEDLSPAYLLGFRQVHFFAGIGVWSYGLRRAGVSDDTAVWTGSCPCQPFSAAGQGGGMDDERHLWPAFLHNIRECRPPRVLGEQVASKDGLGWLDLVQVDLEAEGYAIGAVDTCSAGSGAPHIRQRLRFYAHDLRSAASSLGNAAIERPLSGPLGRIHRVQESRRSWHGQSERSGHAGWLDHHHHQGLEGFGSGPEAKERQRQGSFRPVAQAGKSSRLADASDFGHERSGATRGWRIGPSDDSGTGSLADAGSGSVPQPLGRPDRGDGDAATSAADRRPGPTNGFWRDADWVFCRDEKWRPIRPGSFPLVDGSAFRLDSGSPYAGKSRQGMLKAFGNAIDAEATVDFIEACLAIGPADHLAAGSLDLEDLLA